MRAFVLVLATVWLLSHVRADCGGITSCTSCNSEFGCQWCGSSAACVPYGSSCTAVSQCVPCPAFPKLFGDLPLGCSFNSTTFCPTLTNNIDCQFTGICGWLAGSCIAALPTDFVFRSSCPECTRRAAEIQDQYGAARSKWPAQLLNQFDDIALQYQTTLANRSSELDFVFPEEFFSSYTWDRTTGDCTVIARRSSSDPPPTNRMTMMSRNLSHILSEFQQCFTHSDTASVPLQSLLDSFRIAPVSFPIVNALVAVVAILAILVAALAFFLEMPIPVFRHARKLVGEKLSILDFQREVPDITPPPGNPLRYRPVGAGGYTTVALFVACIAYGLYAGISYDAASQSTIYDVAVNSQNIVLPLPRLTVSAVLYNVSCSAFVNQTSAYLCNVPLSSSGTVPQCIAYWRIPVSQLGTTYNFTLASRDNILPSDIIFHVSSFMAGSYDVTDQYWPPSTCSAVNPTTFFPLASQNSVIRFIFNGSTLVCDEACQEGSFGVNPTPGWRHLDMSATWRQICEFSVFGDNSCGIATAFVFDKEISSSTTPPTAAGSGISISVSLSSLQVYSYASVRSPIFIVLQLFGFVGSMLGARAIIRTILRFVQHADVLKSFIFGVIFPFLPFLGHARLIPSVDQQYGALVGGAFDMIGCALFSFAYVILNIFNRQQQNWLDVLLAWHLFPYMVGVALLATAALYRQLYLTIPQDRGGWKQFLLGFSSIFIPFLGPFLTFLVPNPSIALQTGGLIALSLTEPLLSMAAYFVFNNLSSSLLSTGITGQYLVTIAVVGVIHCGFLFVLSFSHWMIATRYDRKWGQWYHTLAGIVPGICLPFIAPVTFVCLPSLPMSTVAGAVVGTFLTVCGGLIGSNLYLSPTYIYSPITILSMLPTVSVTISFCRSVTKDNWKIGEFYHLFLGGILSFFLPAVHTLIFPNISAIMTAGGALGSAFVMYIGLAVTFSFPPNSYVMSLQSLAVGVIPMAFGILLLFIFGLVIRTLKDDLIVTSGKQSSAEVKSNTELRERLMSGFDYQEGESGKL